MSHGAGVAAVLGALVLAVGCAGDRVHRGVFYSAKGYHVTLPADGWERDERQDADLALRRAFPPGGMVAEATCEGKPPRRPLALLARHATFGLAHREVVHREDVTVAGWPAVRTMLRGQAGETDLKVESVVTKDERCVYDFLYVAPAEHFERGLAEFQALVGSFGGPLP